MTQETTVLGDDSIQDRLFSLIPDDDGQRARFGPALRTAARQLETRKPVPVPTYSNRVPVVLAVEGRCVSFDCVIEDTVKAVFDELIEAVVCNNEDDRMPAVGFVWQMIDTYGAAPGEQSRKGKPPLAHCVVAIGELLATLPAETLVALAAAVTDFRRDGVCPALVAVVEASLSGDPDSVSLGWPLLVPTGKYLDYFTAQVARENPRRRSRRVRFRQMSNLTAASPQSALSKRIDR